MSSRACSWFSPSLPISFSHPDLDLRLLLLLLAFLGLDFPQLSPYLGQMSAHFTTYGITLLGRMSVRLIS